MKERNVTVSNVLLFSLNNFISSLNIEKSSLDFRFVGHSRGGLIAISLAKEFPNQTSEVITVGTPFGKDSMTGRLYFYRNMTRLDRLSNFLLGNAPFDLRRIFNTAHIEIYLRHLTILQVQIQIRILPSITLIHYLVIIRHLELVK